MEDQLRRSRHHPQSRRQLNQFMELPDTSLNSDMPTYGRILYLMLHYELGNFKYLGFVSFGIVAISVAICLAWTIYHRKSRVVQAAQPFFLIMIATGILIFGSSLIPLSFDDEGTTSTSSSATLVIDNDNLAWPWYSEVHFMFLYFSC